LIGNKCDLERAVTKDEAQALADQFQLKYFETSAKEATNVELAFQTLAEMVLQRRLNGRGKFVETATSNGIVGDGQTNRGGGCKC
jgi:GTPase SAR1 family protein